MHLLRYLFFIFENYYFLVEAVHIPRKMNMQADALSRNCVSSFFQMTPGATRQTVQVPGEALELLVQDKPDLTSVNWTVVFPGLAPAIQKAYQAGKKRYLDFY